MKILTPVKIAEGYEDIWELYEKVQPYIEEADKEKFDKQFDSFEDEEEAENYFGDVLIDYLNEVIAGDDVVFGINRFGSIGFWPPKDIDDEDEEEDEEEEYDEDDEDEDEDEEEDEEEEDDEDEYDEDEKNKEKDYREENYEGEEPTKKIGELLDEDNNFVKKIEYTKGKNLTTNPNETTISFWLSKERFPSKTHAKNWLADHGKITKYAYSTDGFWSFPQVGENIVKKYKKKIRSKYITEGVLLKFVPVRLL